MLSKMMLPNAANNYSIHKSQTDHLVPPKASENPSIVLSPAVDSQNIGEEGRKRKSNSNWEKYKDIVNKSNLERKSPPKRHLINSKSSNKGIRSAKKHIRPMGANNGILEVNQTRPNMDLENTSLTKQIAMDCEMVGIGDGTESMLARISLVNRHGACIYDKYVKPREIVQDYRTAVSGIRPHHLKNGEDFETVQREVAEILKGRILVGHALKNDLDVLFLSHPRRSQRDTSRYKLFRNVSKGNTPSLKKLAAELLGIDIQTGEHNSVEDARTTMELYVLYKNRWESDIYSR